MESGPCRFYSAADVLEWLVFVDGLTRTVHMRLRR
jgi:hypothetical protein